MLFRDSKTCHRLQKSSNFFDTCYSWGIVWQIYQKTDIICCIFPRNNSRNNSSCKNVECSHQRIYSLFLRIKNSILHEYIFRVDLQEKLETFKQTWVKKSKKQRNSSRPQCYAYFRGHSVMRVGYGGALKTWNILQFNFPDIKT